jgi:uncharacterized protein YkwD
MLITFLALLTLLAIHPGHDQAIPSPLASLSSGSALSLLQGSKAPPESPDKPGTDAIPLPDYLSPLEIKVWQEINRVRQDPLSYLPHLRRHWERFEGSSYKMADGTLMLTKEGRAAVEEAVAFLEKAMPLPPLRCSRGLSWAAGDHQRDQAGSGGLGHRGSGGSSLAQRVGRYGNWQGALAENITYGFEDPCEIVASFIIDDGVPDRGHRLNLFNPSYRVLGLAYGYHPQYRSMCVVDFAAGFREKKW